MLIAIAFQKVKQIQEVTTIKKAPQVPQITPQKHLNLCKGCGIIISKNMIDVVFYTSGKGGKR